MTLRIAWGERVALLGPNGAGKSTLLRVLGTLTPPSAGQVRVAGLPVQGHRSRIRRRLGLLAHQTYLFGPLTALENLLFYGRLYDLADPGKRARHLLERVGLAERATTRVRQLSRGMQQRLALARVLLHDPDILLLDEPDTGLDQDGLALLKSIVAERPERAVVLATHDLGRAASLCERAVVLVRGRVVRDVPTSQLCGELEPVGLQALGDNPAGPAAAPSPGRGPATALPEAGARSGRRRTDSGAGQAG